MLQAASHKYLAACLAAASAYSKYSLHPVLRKALKFLGQETPIIPRSKACDVVASFDCYSLFRYFTFTVIEVINCIWSFHRQNINPNNNKKLAFLDNVYRDQFPFIAKKTLHQY